ncbi:hypothetical protein BS47DRAFT_1302931, partial [Hydnum rufescens UP504]
TLTDLENYPDKMVTTELMSGGMNISFTEKNKKEYRKVGLLIGGMPNTNVNGWMKFMDY